MIWMGETEEADLSNGWIDPASLELVFDGSLDFEQGEHEIMITLDQPMPMAGATSSFIPIRWMMNG